MILSDFFDPFTLTNVFECIAVFLMFDISGYVVSRILHFPRYLRLVSWIAGVAIYVTLWFYLHLFIPYKTEYAWMTLIVLTGLCLYPYVRLQGIRSFVEEGKHVLIFLFVLPIAKSLFFLVSAPPYIWDEMAYHFYSPARLATEKNWLFVPHPGQVGPGLYDLLPRFLDTAYILMFSLTHTYAIARLLHLLIVICCLYICVQLIRQRIGYLAGGIFFIAAIYFTPAFLRAATWGYVDAGTAAFTVLSLLISIDWLERKKAGSFFAAVFFVGLGVSSKYTSLPYLGSLCLVVCVLFCLLHRKTLLQSPARFFLQYILGGAALWVLTGGYWYIKNIFVTGNPIYPFFFSCKSPFTCGAGTSFFAGWTIPLELSHAQEILGILFNNQEMFVIMTVVILLCSLVFSFMKRTFSSLLTIVIICSIFLEVMLAKQLIGFELRYFYHWSLIVPVILILPYGVIKILPLSGQTTRMMSGLLSLCLLGLLISPVKETIYAYTNPDGVDGPVRNYAMRRMTLNEWISFYFPEMHNVIQWCGESHPMTDLYYSDPALIWTTKEGLMRAYMVNCNLLGQSPEGNRHVEQQADTFADTHKDAYLASLYECKEEISDDLIERDPVKVNHYLYNQTIICRSKKIQEHLYQIK